MRVHEIIAIVCFAFISGGAYGVNIWPNSRSDRDNGNYPEGLIVWHVEDCGSTLYGASKAHIRENGNTQILGFSSVDGHLTIPATIKGWIDDDYVEYSVKTMESTTTEYYINLSSVTVSEGVEAIYGSFSSCYSLSSVILPPTVRVIGDKTFDNCTNLVSVNMPASIENIGARAFAGARISAVSLPNSCTNIGIYAFNACTNLVSLSLGSVKSLGDNAFDGCTALRYVKIPSSLESVGSGAFRNCTGLEKVDFGEGLDDIPGSMFYGCSGIKEIILPEGLKDVGRQAFGYCTSAEKIVIPSSVTNMGRNAFYGCYPKDLTEGALWSGVSYSSVTNFTLLPGPATMESKFFNSKNVQKVTLPDTVKTIADQAFKGCTNLREVTVSDSVETVGNSAFAECSALKDFPLLHGGCVTNWGAYVFSGCNGIEKLTVPGGLRTIPQGMFSACTNLREIVIEEGVETVSPYSFSGDDAVEKIVLPSTATNMTSYAGMDAGNLRVATFNELHPPKNIVTAFLDDFNGTAYYPPQFADEWATALAKVGGACKSWADATETDPGAVEVDGVSISYGWLAKYGLTTDSKPEAAVNAKTGKKDGAGREMTVLDDYIAGTDPSDPESRFTAKIDVSGGVPAISFEPNLNTNGVNRIYTIYGKEDLNDEWIAPTNATHRFFKVKVSMP